MKTFHTLSELRQALAQERAAGRKIGLVPTMGNLHAGHIALVHQAKANSDIVVATIFVNPLQFAAGEDLDKYPHLARRSGKTDCRRMPLPVRPHRRGSLS